MAIAATCGMTACSDDFLEVENPMAETIDTYFTTNEHVQEALVAAYDPLHWPDWAMSQYNPLCIMSDIMADQLWVGGSDKTDNQFWHLMMNYEALPTNCMTGIWTDAYSGVKRCNDVLTYISWASDIPAESQKSYEAQARLLRVYYYSWLWKFWGNIPYYEKNLSGNFLCEQIGHDKVYANMMADLEGVISMNALPMKQDEKNYGRMTQAFAYMLYTELALYQQDESRYATALGYMQEIISSGKYALNPDYGKIFTEEGEWCDESIYEVIYKDDNAARSYDNPLYAGGTVLPRLIGPYNYAAGSGDAHANGWGFAPMRQETVDMFDDADARKLATCWNAAATGTYETRYQDTGWFLEKYAPTIAGNADQIADTDLNYNCNLRIYRYAETLLNAAELLLRTGGSSATAKQYLNEVHNRSGLTDQREASLENILDERRYEFVGEGKRYWDLIRFGEAANVLVPDSYGYRTNSWSESKKYLPIPQSEIDAAQNTLTQNNY